MRLAYDLREQRVCDVLILLVVRSMLRGFGLPVARQPGSTVGSALSAGP